MINLSLSLENFVSYSFIWMLLVLPSCVFSADDLHTRCRGKFRCGDQSGLFYPFWNTDRQGCGHPDFKVECNTNSAEVSISSVKYTILDANYDSGVIRLARSDFIDNLCPYDPINVPFNQIILPFAPNTELLTIYYDCRQNFSQFDSSFVGDFDCLDDGKTNYYVTRNLSSPEFEGNRDLLNDFSIFCEKNVSIPASGPALNTLWINRNTDTLKEALEHGFRLALNQNCSICINTGGACGYSQDTSTFVCYPKTKDEGLSTGVKAGIAIAAVGFLIVIAAAVLLCFARRRKKTQEAQYITSKDFPITSYSSIATASRMVGKRQMKTSDYLEQKYLNALIPLKHYSYAQVNRITKSFTEVVGKGGFGTVYKGTLCDGRSVAVKILKDSKGNGEDFINEVASMSKTSHVNIVSLLGFCSEGSKRAIIYEYMENGSLDQYISSNTSMNVDWMKLYGIALGVARGLEYLHHGCNTRIVHFDIKPQNVLLDDNLCPKVSDFGLAKLCEKKESILSLLDTRGTIGYIAPEVFSRMYGGVSYKSDVYSYGMLVIEMIGARDKTCTENSASNPSSMYFPEWIYKEFEKGDNGRLYGNGITCEEEDIAKKMKLVSLWCIQPCPSDRPPMNRVVEMMEGNLSALEVPPRPVLQIPAAPLLESSVLAEDISVHTEV